MNLKQNINKFKKNCKYELQLKDSNNIVPGLVYDKLSIGTNMKEEKVLSLYNISNDYLSKKNNFHYDYESSMSMIYSITTIYHSRIKFLFDTTIYTYSCMIKDYIVNEFKINISQAMIYSIIKDELKILYDNILDVSNYYKNDYNGDGLINNSSIKELSISISSIIYNIIIEITRNYNIIFSSKDYEFITATNIILEDDINKNFYTLLDEFNNIYKPIFIEIFNIVNELESK